MEGETKTCKKCKRSLPLSEFYYIESRKWVKPVCKACLAFQHAAMRERNLKARRKYEREQRREWTAKNPLKVAACRERQRRKRADARQPSVSDLLRADPQLMIAHYSELAAKYFVSPSLVYKVRRERERGLS